MNWYEPTSEQLVEWHAWLKGRPKVVRELGERFPPWKLYRLRSTGHRCTTRSISEDGTLKVAVSAEFNLLGFERHVFGIAPGDLEECDLPLDGELVGTANLTDEQIRAMASGEAEMADFWLDAKVKVKKFKRKEES